jgi:hypothetical protein
MELTKIADSNCKDGDCPAVYRTDRAPSGCRVTRSAEARRAGKTVRRVRVVRRPLTDYIQYEFAWGFVYNVEAGEDIRVLDLTDQPGPQLPDHDFWLFDDTTVVKLLYRPDGTQEGRELLVDPDLGVYPAWRDAAWQAAVPFRDYWAGLPSRV